MIYQDIKGKEILKFDQILYAVAGRKLKVGRVLKIFLDGSGISVIGKNNKRAALIKNPEIQVWQLKKEYYKNHRTQKA